MAFYRFVIASNSYGTHASGVLLKSTYACGGVFRSTPEECVPGRAHGTHASGVLLKSTLACGGVLRSTPEECVPSGCQLS